MDHVGNILHMAKQKFIYWHSVGVLCRSLTCQTRRFYYNLLPFFFIRLANYSSL